MRCSGTGFITVQNNKLQKAKFNQKKKSTTTKTDLPGATSISWDVCKGFCLCHGDLFPQLRPPAGSVHDTDKGAYGHALLGMIKPARDTPLVLEDLKTGIGAEETAAMKWQRNSPLRVVWFPVPRWQHLMQKSWLPGALSLALQWNSSFFPFPPFSLLRHKWTFS